MRDDPAEAERAARLLDAMGTDERDDEEIEAEHRASRLAAAREFAPDARLDEELRLRLTGPETDGGALRFQWGDALLEPVEHMVSVAAGTPVHLELTGSSTGSTIVHARPVITRAGSADPDVMDAPPRPPPRQGSAPSPHCSTLWRRSTTSVSGHGSSTRSKRWHVRWADSSWTWG
ncbi:hypothetical protein [Streptomyces brasiliscabiei]|uniref:hypothetical protein n=1 Tax=Streptomyces brasiliscabiei TaxID=2736302 RepID=UPI001C11C3E1|nr:hypothetical protein [Streptomyces brasiliscabiei]